MRILIAALCLTLQGCAGITAYVQQHAAGIAAFSMVAGAVAAGEGAVVNAITLKEKLTDDK